jgi:hypothetical protein
MGKGVAKKEKRREKKEKKPWGIRFLRFFYHRPILYLNKIPYSDIMLGKGMILLSKGDLWLTLNN